MRKWLWDDGWRYHLLSAAVFLGIAVPVGIANAYFDWPIGATYAAAFASLVLAAPFVERRHLFSSPPRPDRPRSHERPRAGAA
ncbi:MAG: hypothetical protein ACR2OC_09860 [Solirubrobacterales bacterium]